MSLSNDIDTCFEFPSICMELQRQGVEPTSFILDHALSDTNKKNLAFKLEQYLRSELLPQNPEWMKEIQEASTPRRLCEYFVSKKDNDKLLALLEQQANIQYQNASVVEANEYEAKEPDWMIAYAFAYIIFRDKILRQNITSYSLSPTSLLWIQRSWNIRKSTNTAWLLKHYHLEVEGDWLKQHDIHTQFIESYNHELKGPLIDGCRESMAHVGCKLMNWNLSDKDRSEGIELRMKAGSMGEFSNGGLASWVDPVRFPFHKYHIPSYYELIRWNDGAVYTSCTYEPKKAPDLLYECLFAFLDGVYIHSPMRGKSVDKKVLEDYRKHLMSEARENE